MDFNVLQPDGVKRAHHDCLLRQDIGSRANDMLLIAGWIDPNAANWLRGRSRVHALLASKP